MKFQIAAILIVLALVVGCKATLVVGCKANEERLMGNPDVSVSDVAQLPDAKPDVVAPDVKPLELAPLPVDLKPELKPLDVVPEVKLVDAVPEPLEVKGQ